MRPPVDERRIRELAHRFGRVARFRVRLYLTGGATAVREGWRDSTIDVDLRFEPESDELLREIPALKEALGVNIELASPPDFISQALSKIERSFDQDREDVRQLIMRGLVEPVRLGELFDAIEPELFRYPAIDPPTFRRRVHETVDG